MFLKHKDSSTLLPISLDCVVVYEQFRRKLQVITVTGLKTWVTCFRVNFTNVNKHMMFLRPVPSLSFFNRTEPSWCVLADGQELISGRFDLPFCWHWWWLLRSWVPKAQQGTKPTMVLALVGLRVTGETTSQRETQVEEAGKHGWKRSGCCTEATTGLAASAIFSVGIRGAQEPLQPWRTLICSSSRENPA